MSAFSSMQRVNSLNEMWRVFCIEAGLDQFSAEITVIPTGDYDLFLSKKIMGPDVRACKTEIEVIETVLGPVMDAVRNSPMVKRQLEDKDREISKLKTEVEELKKLRAFKTHFDLAFTLQHGKRPEGM